MLSFFPLDVLDEIWDLIESVSEGFPTFSSTHQNVLKIIIKYLSSRKFYLPSFINIIIIIKKMYGKLLFYTDYLD